MRGAIVLIPGTVLRGGAHVLDIVDVDDMRQRVLATDCDEQRDAAEHTAETVLRTARSYAEASDTEITTATASGRPARQILAYAEENGMKQYDFLIGS